jgi:Domain of unknown function (DUF4347)
MPKIWAYQPGAFRAGGGWDDVISLTASDNLTNLIAQLEESGLQGSVEKLALVFHGDAGGVVRSDPVMTQSSVFENPAVAGRVAQLRDYLTPHASVIFYCCMSGVGPEGSNFLKALSTSWPGRTVVGFVTSGYVDPQYFTAGDVFDVVAAIIGAVPQGMIRRDARGRITLPRMDPRGATAKEARDGGITRMPPREAMLGGPPASGSMRER